MNMIVVCCTTNCWIAVQPQKKKKKKEKRKRILSKFKSLLMDILWQTFTSQFYFCSVGIFCFVTHSFPNGNEICRFWISLQLPPLNRYTINQLFFSVSLFITCCISAHIAGSKWWKNVAMKELFKILVWYWWPSVVVLHGFRERPIFTVD